MVPQSLFQFDYYQISPKILNTLKQKNLKPNSCITKNLKYIAQNEMSLCFNYTVQELNNLSN